MAELAGYIKGRDGQPVYAVYHAPDTAQKARVPVLIAPALFEERKSAYASLRRLGVMLARDGHPVLRFDYRGTGESGGKAGCTRLATMREDLETCAEELRSLSGVKEVMLLGLRAGGSLVLQCASEIAGVSAVISLAPIVSGSAQVRLWRMRSKMRSELTQETSAQSKASAANTAATGSSSQSLMDFDGFAVHPGFFDDIAAVNLTQLPPLNIPSLIAQISHRTDAAPESTKLAAALGEKAQLHCLRMEPFWDRLDDVDTQPLEALVSTFAAKLD